MFYIQLVIYGTSFAIVVTFFKETRVTNNAITTEMNRHADNEESANIRATWKSLTKFLLETIALPSFLLCTEPVVFFFTLLSGMSYGLVFVSTQSVTQVYTTLYG